MFTTGTNAVHGFSSMDGSIVIPAGITSSMYTGVRKFCPSLKSFAKAETARNNADVVIVIGTSISAASAIVCGGIRKSPPGRMREIVRPRLTMLARAAAMEIDHTARNLPTTISVERSGAQSSVCIVPRSFSPAVRSTAA